MCGNSLGGLKSVNESIIDPINIGILMFGTINSPKTMESFNCTNIVFSSTATIYGNDYNFPIKEDLKRTNFGLWEDKINC